VDPAEGIELPVVYTSVDDAPMLFANQFAIQFNKDEFILTIGQLQPPLLLGTPEEMREQASRLTHVPVRVLVRVGMTSTRVAELAKLLADHLRRYEEQKGTDG
jgi:flagellar motor switch/type III secretory pathway protein FliN